MICLRQRLLWRGAADVMVLSEFFFMNKLFEQTRQSRVVSLWHVPPGQRPPVENVSRPPLVCLPVEKNSSSLQIVPVECVSRRCQQFD